MTITVAIDCMGGDHGPSVTVPAALGFVRDWKVGAYPGSAFVDLIPITKDCRLPDPIDTVLEIMLKESPIPIR